MSNSLDPDQTRQFIAPDLGQNCLPSYQQTTLVDKELRMIFKTLFELFSVVQHNILLYLRYDFAHFSLLKKKHKTF